MNQNRVIVCCNKHTSLNTNEKDKKECPPKKDECAPKTADPCKRVECSPCQQVDCDPCKRFKSVPKKVECEQPRKAKLSGCCKKSADCEQPLKQCGPRVLCNLTATSTSRGCDDEPEPVKTFVPEEKKLSCACVKFNGLQDSCTHPACCTQRGCLDVPFPSCVPAQKWQDEFVCNKKKNNQGC